MTVGPDALPPFGFVAVHRKPLHDGTACEDAWLREVASGGRPVAHLWQGARGLVVPRSYERLPRWQAACAGSAAAGWPVQVRASGGGLVPQGPGVLNLSLLWPAGSATPSGTDEIYRALTGELAAAFARLDVTSEAQAVEGSFCDGRFNLASGGRKLVGTAQAWRRVEGRPLVLAHAVIVASADPRELTEAANRFEARAGSERRYRADALTSVAEAWCAAHGAAQPPPDLPAQVLKVVAERFARIVPPRVHEPGD
jgi:lipoate-protein ligase A